MKKLLAILLAAMMLLSIAACGDDNTTITTTAASAKTTAAANTTVAANTETTTILSQEDLDDIDKALEMLEYLKPEGWDENRFGAYIYDVWDEEALPDCLPGPVEGIKIDQINIKDYTHDVMNSDYSVGPLWYDSYEDYREYSVRFYATEAQLDEYIAEMEAKGFVGGQSNSREDIWWEFNFYNNDGWFAYIFFNTNDNEDGEYAGAASVTVTDSVFPLPEAINGIPLPQRGMTDYDYTKNYTIQDFSEGYEDVDFDLAKDTLPEEYYAAWFSYYGTCVQDAKDYTKQLVDLGWELTYEDEDEDRYYSTLKKGDIYAVSNYYIYDAFMEVGFSDMVENLSY